jgi:hypothetical protein
MSRRHPHPDRLTYFARESNLIEKRKPAPAGCRQSEENEHEFHR